MSVKLSELSREAKQKLLDELRTEHWNGPWETQEKMLAFAVFDGVAPSICIDVDCKAIDDMEPDQDAGHCGECGEQTMVSCLVLAELI